MLSSLVAKLYLTYFGIAHLHVFPWKKLNDIFYIMHIFCVAHRTKYQLFFLTLKIMQDKGGDAANFRTIQTAWEVIVELHRTNKIDKGLFSEYLGSNDGPEVDENEVVDDFDDELYQKYANSTSVPSVSSSI